MEQKEMIKDTIVQGLNDKLPGLKEQFTAIDSLCFENVLYYLIDKYGFKSVQSAFPGLKADAAAAQNNPLTEIMRRLKSRNFLARPKEAEMVTFDLRAIFKEKDVNFEKPEKVIEKLSQKGVKRVVYPYHWLINSYENIEVSRLWVKTAHKYGMEVLLYTGPFGTELQNFLSDKPESINWLQRHSDQSPATYDKNGYLLMFCPSSPYLSVYRLPIILNFIRATGCDGVFFDIPWMLSGACYCQSCQEGNNKYRETMVLGIKEQLVRNALSYAVLIIRSEFPTTWLVVNAAAPGVWESSSIGATPSSMNGLFDEMVVEWTPSTKKAIASISKSVDVVRSQAQGCRVSHAWSPEKNPHLSKHIDIMHKDRGIGKWY